MEICIKSFKTEAGIKLLQIDYNFKIWAHELSE